MPRTAPIAGQCRVRGVLDCKDRGRLTAKRLHPFGVYCYLKQRRRRPRPDLYDARRRREMGQLRKQGAPDLAHLDTDRLLDEGEWEFTAKPVRLHGGGPRRDASRRVDTHPTHQAPRRTDCLQPPHVAKAGVLLHGSRRPERNRIPVRVRPSEPSRTPAAVRPREPIPEIRHRGPIHTPAVSRPLGPIPSGLRPEFRRGSGSRSHPRVETHTRAGGHHNDRSRLRAARHRRGRIPVPAAVLVAGPRASAETVKPRIRVLIRETPAGRRRVPIARRAPSGRVVDPVRAQAHPPGPNTAGSPPSPRRHDEGARGRRRVSSDPTPPRRSRAPVKQTTARLEHLLSPLAG